MKDKKKVKKIKEGSMELTVQNKAIEDSVTDGIKWYSYEELLWLKCKKMQRSTV